MDYAGHHRLNRMNLFTTSPLERTTLSAAAFERLISNIVQGKWKAGEQIPTERVLCQQLGIARNSLREALKAMELLGMVDSRVGEGTFVCPRSEFLSRPLLWAFTGANQHELKNLLEARAMIEADLASMAASRVTVPQLRVIKGTVSLMERQIAAGESVVESDLAFHQAVGEAAHNEVMANAALLLRNMLKYWIHLKLMAPHICAHALERHVEIYEAIRKRDPQAARILMQEHLDETAVQITQLTTGRSVSSKASMSKTSPRKRQSSKASQ
jgi:GntR family transcriptional regulator, transcriptional repressor for pyruvate dehydrogenase complex